jgi:hypothetical protein
MQSEFGMYNCTKPPFNQITQHPSIQKALREELTLPEVIESIEYHYEVKIMFSLLATKQS